MDLLSDFLSKFKQFTGSNALIIAFGLVFLFAFLLILGRRFESALRLERFGIPISLLIGLIVLLIGPYGPTPIFPESVTDIWVGLPTPLLTLVFATLMLGRPIPSAKGLWRPVVSQALLAFLLGFGQYLVGGIAVLFFLVPKFHVDPLMGCLIEVGFEGGHGAASVMGEIFQKIGYTKGLDLGLAMATIGLLSSTIIGSILIILGRFLGWIVYDKEDNNPKEELENSNIITRQFKSLTVNIGLAGISVLLGVLFLEIFRTVASFSGGIFQDVASTFPVFPLALVGSLLLRYLLERFNKTEIVSEIFQREIGILSTDLLIITAIAGLNLPLLFHDWIPLTVLSLVGLIWNILGIYIYSQIALNERWFERSIVEFGNATGVAASGLLLLRLADPTDKSKTLPVFSIKQLFLQPLLSGGLITVIAPLVITRLGLIGWTEICGFITFLLISMALIFKMYTSYELSQ